MKKLLSGIIFLFIAIGVTSSAQAYSFNILGGGIHLDIAPAYESLSLNTTSDLVLGYSDYPGLDPAMDYEYRLTAANVGVTYAVNFPVALDGSTTLNESMDLGIFQGIDLGTWITPGGTANFDGDMWLNGSYGGYTLSNILLTYDFSIVDNDIADTLSLGITTLTLSGGNTPGLLEEITSELTLAMMGTDLSLVIGALGLSADVTLTPGGSLDLQASQVPVPGAALVLASGLISLAGLRRRSA